MTVKTSDLGGTDWSADDVLNAADLNDTYGAVTIHRKLATETTERTHTGDTNWTTVTSGTHTITAQNALVIGISFKCQLKVSGGGPGYARVKVDGTTLTTTYLGYGYSFADSGYVVPILDPSPANYPRTTNAAYTSAFSISVATALKLLDASTTFEVQIKTDDGGDTVAIDEYELGIVYVEGFKDD